MKALLLLLLVCIASCASHEVDMIQSCTKGAYSQVIESCKLSCFIYHASRAKKLYFEFEFETAREEIAIAYNYLPIPGIDNSGLTSYLHKLNDGSVKLLEIEESRRLKTSLLYSVWPIREED